MLPPEEPSSHSQSMELRLSLRRWSLTKAGVKTDAKPTKMHAYREGTRYAGHKIGSPNETPGWAWCHKRGNVWHHPSTQLAYDMRGVRKHRTLGERLPQNSWRCVVHEQQQQVPSTRRSKGGTSRAHNIREVTLSTIQTFQINFPWKILC